MGSVKATEDTLYYIASCTKSFTATTLLSLLEELADGPNAIDLKSKISSIIPDYFVLNDEYATKHATLEDALSHLLGVGHHDLNYGGKDYSLRDAIRSMRHLAMTAEFREKHQYLNMGYMTIQHVIETLTGKPIEASHRRYIWEPIGMKSTFIKLSDAKSAQNILAEAYSWDELNHELVNVQPAEDYPLVGGGGIISSIRDMTNYLRAHMYGGLTLGPSWQKELYRPRAISRESTDRHKSDILYALGWGTYSYHGKRVVTHNGGITGFSSKLLFLPDQKWGVAVLANADMSGYGAVETVVARLLDDFLGLPQGEREDLVSKFDEELEQSLEILANTRTRLYPKLPDPRLKSTLPLAAYAGSYYDPGYRTLELSVAKPLKRTPVTAGTTEVLHCEIRRLVNLTLDFEHVSGDFFIAWSDTEIPNMAGRGGKRVQFVVGSDARVQKMGINLDMNGDEDDRMVVWFKKVT